MNILICGMGRSGSTYTYNICRSILDIETEGQYGHYSYSRAFIPNDNDHTVIKHHGYTKALHSWADVIITCRRNLVDAMISFKNHNHNQNMNLSIATMVQLQDEWFYGWKEYADVDIVYERDIINGGSIIPILLDAFNMQHISSDKIVNNYDKILSTGSLFTKNHRTYAGSLTDDETKCVMAYSQLYADTSYNSNVGR